MREKQIKVLEALYGDMSLPVDSEKILYYHNEG